MELLSVVSLKLAGLVMRYPTTARLLVCFYLLGRLVDHCPVPESFQNLLKVLNRGKVSAVVFKKSCPFQEASSPLAFQSLGGDRGYHVEILGIP